MNSLTSLLSNYASIYPKKRNEINQQKFKFFSLFRHSLSYFLCCFHQTNHFHQYKRANGQRCRTRSERARFEFRWKFWGSLNVKFSQIELIIGNLHPSPTSFQVTLRSTEADSSARKLKISRLSMIGKSQLWEFFFDFRWIFWIILYLMKNPKIHRWKIMCSFTTSMIWMSLIYIEWNMYEFGKLRMRKLKILFEIMSFFGFSAIVSLAPFNRLQQIGDFFFHFNSPYTVFLISFFNWIMQI